MEKACSLFKKVDNGLDAAPGIEGKERSPYSFHAISAHPRAQIRPLNDASHPGRNSKLTYSGSPHPGRRLFLGERRRPSINYNLPRTRPNILRRIVHRAVSWLNNHRAPCFGSGSSPPEPRSRSQNRLTKLGRRNNLSEHEFERYPGVEYVRGPGKRRLKTWYSDSSISDSGSSDLQPNNPSKVVEVEVHREASPERVGDGSGQSGGDSASSSYYQAVSHLDPLELPRGASNTGDDDDTDHSSCSDPFLEAISTIDPAEEGCTSQTDPFQARPQASPLPLPEAILRFEREYLRSRGRYDYQVRPAKPPRMDWELPESSALWPYQPKSLLLTNDNADSEDTELDDSDVTLIRGSEPPREADFVEAAEEHTVFQTATDPNKDKQDSNGGEGDQLDSGASSEEASNLVGANPDKQLSLEEAIGSSGDMSANQLSEVNNSDAVMGFTCTTQF